MNALETTLAINKEMSSHSLRSCFAPEYLHYLFNFMKDSGANFPKLIESSQEDYLLNLIRRREGCAGERKETYLLPVLMQGQVYILKLIALYRKSDAYTSRFSGFERSVIMTMPTKRGDPVESLLNLKDREFSSKEELVLKIRLLLALYGIHADIFADQNSSLHVINNLIDCIVENQQNRYGTVILVNNISISEKSNF